MAKTSHPLRRGQIWWVDWHPHRGSEQAGRRPALIVQTDLGNEEADYGLTIVAAMSTGLQGDDALHVSVEPSSLNGLDRAGVVKCEQLMTITKARLDGYIGVLEPRFMVQVDNALKRILALK